ncbi:MAG: HTH-type transcriptional regulator DegA [Anaerolineales bacterium]|nr:HTH-type transcriptional regulator DegA [Anaerolineales bacterium]
MPVTMRDVAQKADVSIKTVSRVVNDQGEVANETRERVSAAIEELGYRPSKLARALVTQRTDTLGLIVSDITNPFFSEFSCGMLDASQAQGYDVFLCNSGARVKPEIRALRSLADHNVDGIILFPSWLNEDKLRAFVERHRPVVVVNRAFEEHPGMGQVLMDARGGAKLAVDHLVSKGHTAIGMLAGYATYPDVFQRVCGFRETVVAHGLPLKDEWIIAVTPVIEQGRQAALQLLTQHPQVTAVFAYNDLLAVGAIQACRELERRVPDDCAIVGFDNVQLAALITPPLTTVHVDKYELGWQAVTLLVRMLDDPEAELPPVCLDVELVIRESA